MHIATIVGARPQFVKAAVVSRALRQHGGFRETLIHTGQHYDANMSHIFFSELEIPPPQYHLGIGSGTHAQQTGRMLEAIEQVLQVIRPDLVLVYGDTNSTLAGALCAAKMLLPVAHVEAGLRSYNRAMPEEINRVITDHLSSWLFAPTELAVNNLIKENISKELIHLVGDVMYDAALLYGSKAAEQSQICERLSLTPGQYALATIHRAENTDSPQRMQTIVHALCHITETIPIVLPLHPRTRTRLKEFGIAFPQLAGLIVIEPVGFLDMLRLEQGARFILTDSGGVQKEAFFYKVPCITLRSETEWVELLEAGWNHLAPPFATELILDAVTRALSTPGKPISPYGDGNASRKIVDILAGNAY